MSNHDREMKKYVKQRYKEMMENVDDRPYWQWTAVVDNRTCPQCLSLHGKVFMYDNPIWNIMLQRLHRGCRCRIRALSKQNLIERGLTVTNDDYYFHK